MSDKIAWITPEGVVKVGVGSGHWSTGNERGYVTDEGITATCADGSIVHLRKGEYLTCVEDV
ncbi:MAG: hypothetical protein Ta2A_11620 [Treponemataceae bacterium]|nr:MAG: hypothetical protein Ta2A_11620 [Treponemataceae bacterium]